ncbi:MAG TPA: hypothetical protein PLQ98_05235, partial [Bacillota bacterium]|nr:hypothetical protein [Bacillota bacterium]
LKQAEQRNAQLLEQLTQAENFASQELMRLDQMLNQLEGQVSQAVQFGGQSYQQQGYSQPGYTNPGSYGNYPTNPGYSQGQYGQQGYASQYTQGNQNRQ